MNKCYDENVTMKTGMMKISKHVSVTRVWILRFKCQKTLTYMFLNFEWLGSNKWLR